jgi:hypothetical protein
MASKLRAETKLSEAKPVLRVTDALQEDRVVILELFPDHNFRLRKKGYTKPFLDTTIQKMADKAGELPKPEPIVDPELTPERIINWFSSKTMTMAVPFDVLAQLQETIDEARKVFK